MLLQLSPDELEAVSSYWYIKFVSYWGGPFSYIEILQMLRNRRINRSMKIRAGKLSMDRSGDWHTIGELKEFSPEFINEFSKYYVPKGRPFELIRKFVRIDYSSKVLMVSNSGQIEECVCTELSAGGAKIKVPADFINVGEKVKIQFYYNPNLKLKSFKATANILRLGEVQFPENGNDDKIYETYSIEFSDLKARYKKLLLNATQIKIHALASYLKENQKKAVDILDLDQFSKQYPHLLLNP